MTGDDALAEMVMSGSDGGELTVAERGLLDYAVKLTRSPGGMAAEDLERLRRHGYGDRAILDATHIIGYFNHINRVADALGIDLEPEWPAEPPWADPAKDAPSG